MEAIPSPSTPRRGRGLALLSGGLDSMLSLCLLRRQGCHVEAVAFESPFFHLTSARLAARDLGVPLHVIDFTSDVLKLVAHPPHGYGGCLNPCIDCHAAMVRRAGELMERMGFDFVSTGEVLNQRPMSQNRRALGIVAATCGCGDRLLRPLSARRLEPTLPERQGLVDRGRLLDINGRGRRVQMALAAEWGVHRYPSPSGGCLLTESGFCRKLRDLMDHEGLHDMPLVRSLRLGRHFRLPGGAKAVVGRDATENARLITAASGDNVVVHTVDVPGPAVLLPRGACDEDLRLAMGICAGYSDHRGEPVRMRCIRHGDPCELQAPPLERSVGNGWML